MSKSYQKEYRVNMSDEQKQKLKDCQQNTEIILVINRNKSKKIIKKNIGII